MNYCYPFGLGGGVVYGREQVYGGEVYEVAVYCEVLLVYGGVHKRLYPFLFSFVIAFF